MDAFIKDKIGLGLFDLPDRLTWDAWNVATNPKEFAYQVISEEMGDGDV